MSRKSDKRERLIDAAKKLIYQQGFHVTTLSDIAHEADVPLGNIYYYFKTKADIGVAVLNAIAVEQQILFGNLNKEPLPKNRLHYFLEQAKQDGTFYFEARIALKFRSLLKYLKNASFGVA